MHTEENSIFSGIPWFEGGRLLLDVRTPKEFQKGHIPGAVNLPLFLDEERAMVGTIYKQKGSRPAVRQGLDFVGPRLSEILSTVEMLISRSPSEPRLTVYCWRGGMRSASVAWLLRLYGWEPEVIPGGYKAFRKQVFGIFEKSWPIAILGGLTGTGKTRILREMAQQGAAVVDLEKIASHQGSAFGHLGQHTQPTQEHFENLLAHALLRAGQKAEQQGGPVWLEDESRFIGSLYLPNPLWKQICQAPVYLISAPSEMRVARLVEDYGAFPPQDLAVAIMKLRKRLGPVKTADILAALGRGNLSEVARQLLEYYDATYAFSISKRQGPAPYPVSTANKSLKEIAAELALITLKDIYFHKQTV
ncbi:MAG: tRNA 2-selenouridine(34) synthase MnmH [Flavobacteriales bacterium]|nr:tRNA 2-selenouridine(34) synthase MnmH [Flavobacteriales bacterium]